MFLTKNYYVYLLTNWNNNVLYVGVTNDLNRRIYEHKNKLIDGFSKKYNLNKLVYVEETNDINAAIAREKEIKKWRREKKNKLVNQINPMWIVRFLPSVEMTRKIEMIGGIRFLAALRNDNIRKDFSLRSK